VTECKENDDDKVNCCVCSSQVPHSVALSFEGEDYVYWFCGADCHEKWRHEHHEHDDQ